jgi:hypothetical protein
MNPCFRILISAVVALSIGAVASAQSKKVRQSELPEAVQARAAKESAAGKVAGYWARERDGNVVYEVDLVVDGREKGVLIGPDGSVVAVQEEVPFEELDPSVQSGLKQQAGDGKIGKVYSVTIKGKVERYLATVDNRGQKSRVEIGPDGAPPPAPGSER